MAAKAKGGSVTIEGVAVSNPDKVLYPGAGFTKTDVVTYYLGVSRVLLPHLRRRPITLKRYPDGVGRGAFYEKNAPGFAPPWIRTTPVPRAAGGPDINYVLIEDRRTLVWCAAMAALELHPFLHRAPNLERPTLVVFDLDPGEGSDILTCATVAFLMKDVLDRLGLRAFPKVSGSKGVQLYIPLNTAVTYGVTQPFAKTLAELLERRHPALVVADMAKSKRAGKVLIDWSQNAAHKTTVAVYSLRGSRPRPYVSVPVGWDELAAALKKKEAGSLHFDPAAALQRVRTLGDLYAPVLTLEQTLPETFMRELAAPAPPRRPPRAARTRRAGAVPTRSRQGSRRRFVIHEHAGGADDLRLEIGDALTSWTIEGGLPTRRGSGRAATVTDDRPLSDLQGGAGIVRDAGTYEIVEGAWSRGSVRFSLQGSTIAGQWSLSRTKTPGTWRIAKTGSARTAARARRARGRVRTRAPDDDLDTLPAASAAFIEPMRATPAASLPDGQRWRAGWRGGGAGRRGTPVVQPAARGQAPCERVPAGQAQ